MVNCLTQRHPSSKQMHRFIEIQTMCRLFYHYIYINHMIFSAFADINIHYIARHVTKQVPCQQQNHMGNQDDRDADWV